MSKEEFLRRLNWALADMKPLDRARTVQYYREIIEDRIEEGLTEEEAVAGMEPVEEIAAGLLESGAVSPRPRRSGFSTAMLIVGSPVWFPLLLALGILVLALYIVGWALVVSVFAAVLALLVGVPAGLLALLFHWAVSPISGIFLLGAGLICGALGLALLFPCIAAARWLLRSSGTAVKAFWRKVFPAKEGLE